MLADWTSDDLTNAEASAQAAIRALREGICEFDLEITKPKWGDDVLRPLLEGAGRSWAEGESDARVEDG